MTCQRNHTNECNCCMACNPEPVKMYTCAWCGAEIYEENDYYEIEDTIFCEDCVTGFKRTAGEES